MGGPPKKSCAGLYILLVAGIIGLIAVIMSVLMLYTPDILPRTFDNQGMSIIIALISSLLSLVGVGVFIAEYRGHAH